MKSIAVIGCGFGDEGKGKAVSYLCSITKNQLVIRFSGGHQAAHHVVINDKLDHVFSNFGSGTLQGVPTYWSMFCTVEPIGLLNELSVLHNKGIDPVIFIDKQCPITTPYDIKKNIANKSNLSHGTCGVGFGQTIQREEDRYSLKFSDLYNYTVFKIKLNLIAEYYKDIQLSNNELEYFMHDCISLHQYSNIIPTDGLPKFKYDTLIFEGSQGLLLDKDIGFFPHVTRANTGSKNILSMGFKPEILLVTRAYHTRHGNGPLPNDGIKNSIKKNPYEINDSKGMQGRFRIVPLSYGLLKYAVESDRYIYNKNNKQIMITCLDLINGDAIKKNIIDEISFKLNIPKNLIYLSDSPIYNKIVTMEK